MEKELIKRINEELTKSYNVKVKAFGSVESNVLAYYKTNDREIYINKNNKNIFNDFYGFITTMLHEEIHKINHAKGLEDIDRVGEQQIHNKVFKSAMLEVYGFHCSDAYNGEVEFDDKRNQEVFKELMRKKFELNKSFMEISKLYFENVYVKSGDVDGYGDNGTTYEVNDEDGVTI